MSKTIEGVTKVLSPPFLEFAPVFFPEFMELFLRRLQYSGIRLTAYHNGAYDFGTSHFNPTPQVRKRAALSDKVVHKQIVLPRNNVAAKSGLPSQTPVAVCSRMTHYVDLHHRCIERNAKLLAQHFRQRSGDCVKSVALVSMSADQRRMAAVPCFDERTNRSETSLTRR